LQLFNMPPQLQYLAGLALLSPLLPVLFWQGKRVRQEAPELPEAARSRTGQWGEGPPVRRVILLGESTVAGVGVTDHREGLAGQLAAGLSKGWGTAVHWEVVARSGYTAKRVTSELIPQLAGKAADLCVVGLGGNDTFQMTSPRRWRRDVKNLIKAIGLQLPHCPVLFAQLPPVGEFPALTPLLQRVLGGQVLLLHEVLRDLTGQYPGVYFPDRPIRFKEWAAKAPDGLEVEDFFSDGVHPSRLTYAMWAEALADFALEQLAPGRH